MKKLNEIETNFLEHETQEQETFDELWEKTKTRKNSTNANVNKIVELIKNAQSENKNHLIINAKDLGDDKMSVQTIYNSLIQAGIVKRIENKTTKFSDSVRFIRQGEKNSDVITALIKL